MSNKCSEMTKLNRIKEVLVEQKRTSKWLAESLGKDMATVSRWCNNRTQPSLQSLYKIAEILRVEVKELLS